MNEERLHMYRRVAAFCVALMALVAMGSGCLFETRPAAPPTVDDNQILFDDPEDVFTGMRVGLEEDAFSNYQRAIGDGFVFSPLLSDSLDPTFPPDIYSGWTRDVELSVMELVLSEADSLGVVFSPETLVDDNLFVRFRTTYALRVVPRGDDEPVTYEGVADIDVERVGGVWQVVYWDEIERVADSPTWGFLRGFYRGLVN